MSAVEFDQISKRYGRKTVLDGVSLRIPPERLTVICGAPGAGKSVLLRLLIGLETADEGRILVGGRDVSDVPPGRRAIGYVPQSFALYPHLTTYHNIAYPLALARIPRAEIEARVTQVARLLDLEQHLPQWPTQLSGGQKQRAALARGLVQGEALTVLDDPLVGLDYKLRERLVDDLRAMRARLGATMLYATSDSLEALAIADDIAVLDAGRIVEQGPARAIYQNPQHLRTAELVGFPRCNTLPGHASGGVCETALGAFPLDAAGPVTLAVRPESLVPAWSGAVAPGHLAVPGTIRLIEDLGGECVIHFTSRDDRVLVAALPAASMPEPRPRLDDAVTVALAPGAIMAFDASGARIEAGPQQERRHG